MFIGMMMKRGEQSIVEEDMFVGSRSDIELEMRRREPTRLKWICTPGDSGPEIQNMNFGAEDNAKVVRYSTSEVYVRFLVGLPATSAPNQILVPPHSVIVFRLLRTSTDPNLFVSAGRYTPPLSFLLLYF